MRRRWVVVGGLVVVSLVVGYVVGARARGTTPDPSAAGAGGVRLRVAAWLQEWTPVDPTSSTELHVSPDGAGTVCSSDRPCSLVGAREQVRQQVGLMATDLVVTLAGGEYAMAEPFVLDARDSGRNGHRVVYRAAAGQTPVLSGGQTVAGWQPAGERPGVLVTTVPPGTVTRQVYVNGVRAVRARGARRPAGWTRTATGFRAPDESLATWRDPAEAEIVSHSEWRAFRCPVGQVTGREVTMAEPCWRNATAPARFGMNEVTWVENALELLDEPGEWYLDRDAARLYYLPRDGEDLAAARVVIAAHESLLELRGTPDEPLHDVGVEGLTFADAGWDRPSGDEGYAATQAGWYRAGSAGPDPLDIERTPGAVRVASARHVRFERNTFQRLGAVGLDVAAGAQDMAIVGNRFHDISGTAIQIGEGRQGSQNPSPRDQLDRLQVADNLIDTVAVEYADAVGIFVSYASNVSLMHNELSHLPYSAISLGWGWGTDSYARNNLIYANRITDVVTTLQDGGAIYTLSPMPGSVIERNYIRGQRNRSGALFLDEGTAFVTVADNVVEESPRWLHIWTASIHDNTIVDNAADGADMLDDGTRNTIARNHHNRASWPAGAQQIIDEAGLEPEYADLRQR